MKSERLVGGWRRSAAAAVAAAAMAAVAAATPDEDSRVGGLGLSTKLIKSLVIN